MAHCEYRNSAFDDSNMHRYTTHSGDYLCWVGPQYLGKFVIGDNEEWRCILHAPDDKPLEFDENTCCVDWASNKRGEEQARLLKELLDEWNRENDNRRTSRVKLLSFVLPGIRCGGIDLSGYNFSADIKLSEATFNGIIIFEGATFDGYAWFSDAKFKEITLFGNATFKGDASFENAEFGTVQPRNGYISFSHATFHRVANFSDTKFYCSLAFDSVKFDNYTVFTNCKFHDLK